MILEPLATLSRVMRAPDTRRRVLGLLAALPLLGGPLDAFHDEEGLAAKRRSRKQGRPARQGVTAQGKKRRRKCKPKSQATICANACGSVRNKQTCKKTIDCGPCDCVGPCGGGEQCCDGRCQASQWVNHTTFGSYGSGGNQFTQPSGAALSADALSIWVADTSNHRIAVWSRPSTSSTEWRLQTTFGSRGSGLNQIFYPEAVAVSANGLTAWVADTSNHRIAVWTRPSASSTVWSAQAAFGTSGSGGSQFKQPTDVAVSRDELTMWIADHSNARVSVWKRSNAGSHTWTNQTVFGSFGTSPSLFYYPSALAVSADALTVWVADSTNNRISIWSRDHAESYHWRNQTTFGTFGTGPNQFRLPGSVRLSANELTLWITDHDNKRIAVWARPTTASHAWSPVTTFGSPGSGPGQFYYAVDTAVSADGQTVFVVDSNGHRISVWGAACPA